jgi:hypothetical protein
LSSTCYCQTGANKKNLLYNNIKFFEVLKLKKLKSSMALDKHSVGKNLKVITVQNSNITQSTALIYTPKMKSSPEVTEEGSPSSFKAKMLNIISNQTVLTYFCRQEGAF